MYMNHTRLLKTYFSEMQYNFNIDDDYLVPFLELFYDDLYNSENDQLDIIVSYITMVQSDYDIDDSHIIPMIIRISDVVGELLTRAPTYLEGFVDMTDYEQWYKDDVAFIKYHYF